MEVKSSWLLEPAERGYLRAAVFLGLGCNAARREDLIDYHLAKDTHFKILPDDVPSDTIATWKSDFYRWIVECGFREIVEYTCLFLDRLYDTTLHIHKQHSEAKRQVFNRKGLAGKIETFNKEFHISCRYPDSLASVYAIRNCLVHRLGLVGPEDIGSTGKLTLSWIGAKTFFQGEDGIEYEVPDLGRPGTPPWKVPCAGGLAVAWREKTLSFAQGALIELEPHALHEILFFVRNSSGDFVESLVTKATLLGRIKQRPNSERSASP